MSVPQPRQCASQKKKLPTTRDYISDIILIMVLLRVLKYASMSESIQTMTYPSAV